MSKFNKIKSLNNQNKFKKIKIDTTYFLSDLCEISKKYKTDKSPFNLKHRHAYTGIYHFLFHKIKEEKLIIAVEELKRTSSVLYCSNLTLWNEKRNTKKLLRKDYPQTRYDYLFESGSAGCTYVFTVGFARRLIKQLEVIEYKRWLFLSHDWLIYFYARINDDLVYFDSNSYILYRIHDKNVHGHLNIFSFKTILAKSQLVRRGWYNHNIRGFRQLMVNRPEALFIYNSYERDWISRLWVCLKFNFHLIRSKKKFFNFLLISISVLPSIGGEEG